MIFNKFRQGFSGVNHVMIAIMLFVALFFLPLEPFISLCKHMSENPIVLLGSFLIICGGALLPDMDNLKSDGGSAASWDLGIIGSIVSCLMVTISSIMTTIFHAKKDVKPYTQHRFFWHTLLIPITIILLSLFLIPNTNEKIIDLFSNNITLETFPTWLIPSIACILIVLYVGTIMLLKKLKKLPILNINPGLIASVISILITAACIMTGTCADIQFYCICIGIGYTFHLIGDAFADGGVPLLFPITGLFGAFFKKIKLIPLTVKTGSTLESLLKVVFLTLDIILIYFLITTKFI